MGRQALYQFLNMRNVAGKALDTSLGFAWNALDQLTRVKIDLFHPLHQETFRVADEGLLGQAPKGTEFLDAPARMAGLETPDARFEGAMAAYGKKHPVGRFLAGGMEEAGGVVGFITGPAGRAANAVTHMVERGLTKWTENMAARWGGKAADFLSQGAKTRAATAVGLGAVAAADPTPGKPVERRFEEAAWMSLFGWIMPRWLQLGTRVEMAAGGGAIGKGAGAILEAMGLTAEMEGYQATAELFGITEQDASALDDFIDAMARGDEAAIKKQGERLLVMSERMASEAMGFALGGGRLFKSPSGWLNEMRAQPAAEAPPVSEKTLLSEIRMQRKMPPGAEQVPGRDAEFFHEGDHYRIRKEELQVRKENKGSWKPTDLPEKEAVAGEGLAAGAEHIRKHKPEIISFEAKKKEIETKIKDNIQTMLDSVPKKGGPRIREIKHLLRDALLLMRWRNPNKERVAKIIQEAESMMKDLGLGPTEIEVKHKAELDRAKQKAELLIEAFKDSPDQSSGRDLYMNAEYIVNSIERLWADKSYQTIPSLRDIRDRLYYAERLANILEPAKWPEPTKAKEDVSGGLAGFLMEWLRATPQEKAEASGFRHIAGKEAMVTAPDEFTPGTPKEVRSDFTDMQKLSARALLEGVPPELQSMVIESLKSLEVVPPDGSIPMKEGRAFLEMLPMLGEPDMAAAARSLARVVAGRQNAEAALRDVQSATQFPVVPVEGVGAGAGEPPAGKPPVPAGEGPELPMERPINLLRKIEGGERFIRSVEAIESRIGRHEGEGLDPRTFIQRAIDALVSEAGPIEREMARSFGAPAGKRSGEVLPSKDPEVMYQNLATNTPSQVKALLEIGPTDITSPGLRSTLDPGVGPIMKSLRGLKDDFQRWKAELYVYAMEAMTTGGSTAFSKEAAADVAKVFGREPEIEAFGRSVQQTLRHLILEYGRVGGKTDVEIQRMLKKHPFFVPEHRVLGGHQMRFGDAAKDLSRQKVPVKERQGSLKQVRPLAQNLISYMGNMQFAINQMRILNALYEVAGTGRTESWVRRIEELSTSTAVSVRTPGTKVALPSLPGKPGAAETIRFEPVEAGWGRIHYVHNGQRRAMDVRTDVFEVLQRMGAQHVGLLRKLTEALDLKGLTEWHRVGGEFLRAGAVTMSANFMSRAFARDTVGKFLFSRQEGLQARLKNLPVANLVPAIKAVLTPELQRQWQAVGAEYSTFADSLTPQRMVHLSAMLNNNPLGATGALGEVIRHTVKTASAPFKAIQSVGRNIEKMHLMEEFKSLDKAYLESFREAEDAHELAKFQARDVFVAYHRKGSFTKNMGAWFFLNPAIGGMSRLKRAFEHEPAWTTGAVLSSITLPSLLAWWWNKDEEKYREAPIHERLRNSIWVFGDKKLTIPHFFEAGFTFGGLVTEMVDQVYRDADDATRREISDAIFEWVHTTAPFNLDPKRWTEWFPTLMRPSLQVAANQRWNGHPIDNPLRQKFSEEWELFNQSTAEWTKALGKATNTSPNKIQYWINGHLGGQLNQWVRSEIPGWSAYIQSGEMRHANTITRFYEIHDEIQKKAEKETWEKRWLKRSRRDYSRAKAKWKRYREGKDSLEEATRSVLDLLRPRVEDYLSRKLSQNR